MMFDKRKGFKKLLQGLQGIYSDFELTSYEFKTNTLMVIFKQSAKTESFTGEIVSYEQKTIKNKISILIDNFEKGYEITYSLRTYLSPKRITLLYHFRIRFENYIIKEFKINDYLTLKLERQRWRSMTKIFIKDENVYHCKYLLLNIPIDRIPEFDEIDSIDEIKEILDNSLGRGNPHKLKISPETEFLGHCSNLQTWYEYNYDTRLLHSNLAFPLLEKLSKAGDPIAKKIFKEEIGLRLESGFIPTIQFLINKQYLRFFTEKELGTILDNLNAKKRYSIISVALNEHEEAFLPKNKLKEFSEIVGFKLYTIFLALTIRTPNTISSCFDFSTDPQNKGLFSPDKSLYICEIHHNLFPQIKYKEEYSIEKRPTFKKLKYGKYVYYDFDLPKKIEYPKYPVHVVKILVKPVLSNLLLSQSLKILNKNKDIKIAIPEDSEPFKIYSVNEGLAVYITPFSYPLRIYKKQRKLNKKAIKNKG